MAKNVIWTPTPKQERMFIRGENEALYGGAAGGGKSDFLVIDALRDVKVATYKGLILRKTFPQLLEIEEKCQFYYPRLYPGAKYNASKHIWYFPSGGKIVLGSMQYAKDKHKYQGQQFDYIGFDELTMFTYEEYSYLQSRNRPSGPGTRVRMRATSNPGGIGHGWVKQYFVLAAPPEVTNWKKLEVITPEGNKERHWLSSVFVPSNVYDNPHLLKNDPLYVAKLANRGEAEMNALLYGSWDSYEGQVFVEWKNDPAHYYDRKWTHVIEPFEIPKHWQIIRSFDWGYQKPFSVGWFAVDEDGRYYRIYELYGSNGKPNVGVRWTVKQIAEKIREIERFEPNIRERDVYGVADPSIFAEQNGNSYARQMEDFGVYWNPGDNTRMAGKQQFHRRFAFDENGVPMLQIFKNCTEFIRTIPNLVYSEKKIEDIDTEAEDHIYDEARYALMENGISEVESVLKNPCDVFNPLDIGNISTREPMIYL